MTIIITCGRSKRRQPCQAHQMYVSVRAKLLLNYALTNAAPEDFRILSAKYGFLKLTDEIEPYELLMGDPGSVTTEILRQQTDGMTKPIYVAGSKKYVDAVQAVWPDAVDVLAGCSTMFEQHHRLKELTISRKAA